MGIRELLCSSVPNPLSETPYSEWYENSLSFGGSSVARFHREQYGDRPYAAFADDFVAGTEEWDPADWARRFAATGAGYVVLVAKHHDGWCLWPTEVANPHRSGWHSERDLVGELAAAVRAAGLRFGLYYSGGYDWTFDATPVGTFADGLTAIPRADYVAYADAQVRELIDCYQPSVLWNDIAWPSKQPMLDALFEHYFSVVPDGVVNDRWLTSPDLSGLVKVPGVRRAIDAIGRRSVRRQGLVPPKPKFFQFRTPEFTTQPEIDLVPWEATRGMDHGFGYNRTSTDADHLSHDDLIGSLVDTVAKGGNLLLNVGPRGEDAQIPDAQLARLDWLAEWMATHGPGLMGTRPWKQATATSPEGHDLHFTAAGSRLWCFVSVASAGPARVTLPLPTTAETTVVDLDGQALPFASDAAGLVIDLPVDGPSSEGPFVVLAVDHAQS
jgi:alpha-L-fucosidase